MTYHCGKFDKDRIPVTCDFETTDGFDMIDHINKAHSSFYCHLCSFKCKTKSEIEDHDHYEDLLDDILNCDICGQKLPGRNEQCLECNNLNVFGTSSNISKNECFFSCDLLDFKMKNSEETNVKIEIICDNKNIIDYDNTFDEEIVYNTELKRDLNLSKGDFACEDEQKQVQDVIDNKNYVNLQDLILLDDVEYHSEPNKISNKNLGSIEKSQINIYSVEASIGDIKKSATNDNKINYDIPNSKAIACEVCGLEFDSSKDLINHKTNIIFESYIDKTNEFKYIKYEDPDEYYDKIIEPLIIKTLADYGIINNFDDDEDIEYDEPLLNLMFDKPDTEERDKMVDSISLTENNNANINNEKVNEFLKSTKLFLGTKEKQASIQKSCDKCDFKLKTKTHPTYHIKSFQERYSSKCNICNKVILSTKEKQGCIQKSSDKCDFNFKTKIHLTYHIKYFQERYYSKCNICCFNFVKNLNLKSHMSYEQNRLNLWKKSRLQCNSRKSLNRHNKSNCNYKKDKQKQSKDKQKENNKFKIEEIKKNVYKNHKLYKSKKRRKKENRRSKAKKKKKLE